jgi:hypothetical protein
MPNDSPLARSETRAVSLLEGLLWLLASILGAASALIFTIDEAPHPVERGLGMVGLAATVAVIALGLRWLRRRPPAVLAHPVPLGGVPPNGWHRMRLGPAWVDWLAPLIPVGLVGSICVVREGPLDLDAVGAICFLLGVLEALVLPAVLLARRELVALQLTPEGLELRRRGGGRVIVRGGELAAVQLRVQSMRGTQFGELVLRRREGAPLSLREPMSAPLDEVARFTARHMRAPLER